MNMLTRDFITLIGVGITLATLLLHGTWEANVRLDTYVADAAAERRAIQERSDSHLADAAADRRAFQASMDEFSKRMDNYHRPRPR